MSVTEISDNAAMAEISSGFGTSRHNMTVVMHVFWFFFDNG